MVVPRGTRELEQPVHRLVEQRPQDLARATEVPIDRGAADAGGPADLIDPDSVEATLEEEVGGGLEDLAIARRRG